MNKKYLAIAIGVLVVAGSLTCVVYNQAQKLNNSTQETISNSIGQNKTVTNNTVENNKITTSKKFFDNEKLNKLIDDDYKIVQEKGYSQIVLTPDMYDQSLIHLREEMIKVANDFYALGYEAYFNGGVVRDLLFGLVPDDADMSTSATIEEIDKVPNTTVVTGGNGHQHVELAYPGLDFDISTMKSISPELTEKGNGRIPKSEFEGHFSNGVRGLLEDTYTRDLTINSMYYDVKTGNIYDFHGGMHDIRDNIIDTLYDPNLAFERDPTVVVRAMRFKSKYDATFSPRVKKVISKRIDLLDRLSNDYRSYQFSKFFKNGHSLRSFNTLNDYGVLQKYYTSLKSYLDDKNYVQKIQSQLNFFDNNGKTSTYLVYATMYLDRFINDNKDLKKYDDAKAAIENFFTTINKEQENSFSFDCYLDDDITYDQLPSTKVKKFITIQYALTDDSIISNSKKTTEIKDKSEFKEGLLLLKARSQNDSKLTKYVEFWDK